MSSNNKEIMIKNKQKLRTLESMWVNSQVDNLDELIKAKKKDLITKLEEYQNECVRVRYNKNGTAIKEINVNPYIIQKYFFQSINPMQSKEPNYSAEKLAIVWDLYNEILLQVNIKIGDFTPTLTSFCTFAGITLTSFRNYKNSDDIDMRIITEKIDGVCFDSNLSLAQHGKLNEKSTIYRMKSEQEKAEKEQPQIHLHNTEVVDLNELNNKLKAIQSIQNYNQKKVDVIEVKNNE